MKVLAELQVPKRKYKIHLAGLVGEISVSSKADTVELVIDRVNVQILVMNFLHMSCLCFV